LNFILKKNKKVKIRKNPLTTSKSCAIIRMFQGRGEKSGRVPLGQQHCHGVSHSAVENLQRPLDKKQILCYNKDVPRG
jgi:hypothetical protein